MATVRDIVSAALKRSHVIASGETARADESADALAALNRMVPSWKRSQVDVLRQAAWTLNDTFVLFVPPAGITGEALGASSYRGGWNASTNSPALASGTGTKGDVYRVTTAGATALDLVTSWAVDDYAMFDGTSWLKGRSSDQHEQGVVALLAQRLCTEYGVPIPPDVAREADDGWRGLLAHFIVPNDAVFDSAVLITQGRRTWL